MNSSELILEITNYVKTKNNKSTSLINTIKENNRIKLFIGLSNYPDNSNLVNNNNPHYSFLSSVAFFSSKIKPDLLFIFSFLFGNYNETLKFFKYLHTQPTTFTANDVIDYLADIKNTYFFNLDEINIQQFLKSFNNPSFDILIFSTSTLVRQKINSLFSTYNHQDAYIIHPSSRNINLHPEEWISQYTNQSFSGQINNSKLTYSVFLI